MPVSRVEERIRVGDELEVEVKDQKQLSGAFIVRPNGTYQQPLVGDLEVEGLTEKEASLQVAKLLEGIVVAPAVAIVIGKRKPIEVPVLGEVRSVGTQQVQLGASMLDLLARCGGLSDFASRTGIYVIRRKPTLIRIRFDYDALVGGERRHVEFRLREGDVVVVK